MKKPTHPPLPPFDDTALEAHIHAASALVGLKIDPAFREGVKLHLRATSHAARLVLELALDDEAEPAPVFRA